MKRGPHEERSFQLALKVFTLCNKYRSQKDFVISHQLLKSGTSVGANISEAQ